VGAGQPRLAHGPARRRGRPVVPVRPHGRARYRASAPPGRTGGQEPARGGRGVAAPPAPPDGADRPGADGRDVRVRVEPLPPDRVGPDVEPDGRRHRPVPVEPPGLRGERGQESPPRRPPRRQHRTLLPLRPTPEGPPAPEGRGTVPVLLPLRVARPQEPVVPRPRLLPRVRHVRAGRPGPQGGQAGRPAGAPPGRGGRQPRPGPGRVGPPEAVPPGNHPNRAADRRRGAGPPPGLRRVRPNLLRRELLLPGLRRHGDGQVPNRAGLGRVPRVRHGRDGVPRPLPTRPGLRDGDPLGHHDGRRGGRLRLHSRPQEGDAGLIREQGRARGKGRERRRSGF
jgi:hypothetical protein